MRPGQGSVPIQLIDGPLVLWLGDDDLLPHEIFPRSTSNAGRFVDGDHTRPVVVPYRDQRRSWDHNGLRGRVHRPS